MSTQWCFTDGRCTEKVSQLRVQDTGHGFLSNWKVARKSGKDNSIQRKDSIMITFGQERSNWVNMHEKITPAAPKKTVYDLSATSQSRGIRKKSETVKIQVTCDTTNSENMAIACRRRTKITLKDILN